MNDMQVFGVERLEDRTLLAVNVTQNGVNLVITGDAEDDLIGILGAGDGEVLVVADTDGDGEFEYLDYSGVKDIHVSAGDGDDEIIAYGLEIAGDFSVDTGAGEDLVFMSGTYGGYYQNVISGNVSVTTGDGNDDVLIAGTEIDGKLTIDTGSGHDEADLGDFALAYSDFLGEFLYTYGELDVDGKTLIDTGSGGDYVGIGADDDDIELGDLVINAGADDDAIEIDAIRGYASITVEGRTDINLGAGHDVFHTHGDAGSLVFVGNFSADGRDGIDHFHDIDSAVFLDKFTVKNFELLEY